VFAIAFGVAAMLMAIVALGTRTSSSPGASTVTATAQPMFSARVLRGHAEIDGRLLSVGDTWSPGSRVVAGDGFCVVLAHAVVDLDSSSAATWDAARRTLTLHTGGAHLDVDPTRGRGFRVATDHFVAHVMGTRFDVDQEHVRVTHGLVRVTSPDGTEPLAELGAGREWQRSSVLPHEVEPEPAAAPDEPAPPSRAGALGGGALLSQARHDLAQGHVEQAKRAIDAAQRQRLTREQAAEARSLIAECALVAGDHSTAASRYADVAERYADSPAGESALFAAARAEEKAGHPSAARDLFRKYVDRYPTGRFRKEVENRLRILERR
jgi:hypothetical protein